MNQHEAYEAWIKSKQLTSDDVDLTWGLAVWKAASATQLIPECTRSHPHELMDGYCELRTEIARLTNENARLKAAQAAQPAEPTVKESLTDQAVAYIRAHPDGTYSNELLCVWQIEKVRRESGAWIALYATPPNHLAVMRQALEALELTRDLSPSTAEECLNKRDAAIAALRAIVGGE